MTARTPEPRPFDIGPLLDACGIPAQGIDAGSHNAGPPAKLAARIGCNRKQIHRWRRYGMTANQADLAAMACGFHPGEIWPAIWWA